MVAFRFPVSCESLNLNVRETVAWPFRIEPSSSHAMAITAERSAGELSSYVICSLLYQHLEQSDNSVIHQATLIFLHIYFPLLPVFMPISINNPYSKQEISKENDV